MRFLGDMGVAKSTIKALRDAGHDATHLDEEGLRRLPDWDILQKASVEDARYRVRRLPIETPPKQP